MWLKRSQPALSVRWREEGKMASSKKINPQDLNYVNVPNSIIEQGWFRREKAVRAWVFYLWHAILPRYEENRVKTIKRQTFTLKEGEMICTRSYLADRLGIHENIAKSSTDSLKRSKAIKVQQEVISKDIEKAPKNKLSRITVNGVPIPDEPYTTMYIPVDMEDMWTTPGLAQLYIYLLCTACHKETYMIGTGGKALLAVAGDVRLSYSHILNTLKCKEWVLKKNLRTLEEAGAIRRVERIGNKGVLVHLNYYPEHKQKEVKDTKVDELLELTTKPAKCQNVKNGEQNHETTEKVAMQQPKTVVPPTPLPQYKPTVPASQEAEILDTPVTEAIKYLFFDLKRNKDIGYLNTIIDFINKELPTGFPVEELRAAMDLYYSEHGEKFIDKQTLLKSINKYYNQYKYRKQQQQEEKNKINELIKRKQEMEKAAQMFNITWRKVGQAYKLLYTENKDMTSLSSEDVNDIYYTLYCANMRKEYVDRNTLKKIPVSLHSPSWNDDICKMADYVSEFFSHFEDYEALCVMYRQEYYTQVTAKTKKYESLKEEIQLRTTNLEKAV